MLIPTRTTASKKDHRHNYSAPVVAAREAAKAAGASEGGAKPSLAFADRPPDPEAHTHL